MYEDGSEETIWRLHDKQHSGWEYCQVCLRVCTEFDLNI